MSNLTNTAGLIANSTAGLIWQCGYGENGTRRQICYSETAKVMGFTVFMIMSCLIILALCAMCNEERRLRTQQEDEESRRKKRLRRIEEKLVVRPWRSDAVTVANDNEGGGETEKEKQMEKSCSKSLHCTFCGLECAICLGEFEEGDLICESNNIACPHQYHKECMLEWLRKHDECCICRQPYLLDSV